MVKSLHNRRGQTSVEYLMLLALAFVMAYIVMTRPIANLTLNVIGNLRSGIQNVIQNAEWTSENLEAGQGKHPANPSRLKAEHL